MFEFDEEQNDSQTPAYQTDTVLKSVSTQRYCDKYSCLKTFKLYPFESRTFRLKKYNTSVEPLWDNLLLRCRDTI